MPTWGQILNELGKTWTPQGVPDFDAVRRKYLQELYKLTQRPVILYATGFLESRLQPVPPGDLQIGLLDLQGFMECMTEIEDGSDSFSSSLQKHGP
jgi:hypothetical protein